MKGARRLITLSAISIAIVFLCSLSAFAQVTDAIQNWTAPPYWSRPQAAPDSDSDHGGREALASGRQALAGGPVALPFISLFPCRLVDTRAPAFPAPLGGGYLPAATVRSYTLTGVCNIPANAQAVSLNATVVKPAGPGFLTLYPQGGAFPPVSTLNYLGNDVIVNAAVVPLSATGGISMALGVSGGDVVLDTNGYYAAQPSVAPYGRALQTVAQTIPYMQPTPITFDKLESASEVSLSGGGITVSRAGLYQVIAYTVLLPVSTGGYEIIPLVNSTPVAFGLSVHFADPFVRVLRLNPGDNVQLSLLQSSLTTPPVTFPLGMDFTLLWIAP